MKKEKKNKIVFITYIIISISYFICAVSGFVDGNNMAVAYFCLGACFLCLASVHYPKYKDENKENKEDKE